MTVVVQPKQRIRGPNLRVLVNSVQGVPFEEGLQRACAENRVIVSNKRLDKALVGSEEWKGISEVFACWSGTMTAYTKPNEAFLGTVEYVDPETGYRWVFRVPEEYQGVRNAILVAEHPDYTLEVDGNNRVLHAATVNLVEAFPVKDGCYLVDPVHGIPTGPVADSWNSRCLNRIARRVGPVWVAPPEAVGYIQWSINLDIAPSRRSGIIVESRVDPNSYPPHSRLKSGPERIL